MLRVAVALLLTLTPLLLFLGCADPDEPRMGVGPPVDPIDEPSPGQATAIELTKASNTDLQQVIAQHQGKIVVVDYWATWCTTCMELMPHTAELQQAHADDLVVITVCLDDEDKAPVAKEFLASLKGDFTNLLSSVGGGPKTLKEYQLDDGIPHYKFYDREGNLAKVLDTDQERLATNESIETAVNELLAAEAK